MSVNIADRRKLRLKENTNNLKLRVKFLLEDLAFDHCVGQQRPLLPEHKMCVYEDLRQRQQQKALIRLFQENSVNPELTMQQKLQQAFAVIEKEEQRRLHCGQPECLDIFTKNSLATSYCQTLVATKYRLDIEAVEYLKRKAGDKCAMEDDNSLQTILRTYFQGLRPNMLKLLNFRKKLEAQKNEQVKEDSVETVFSKLVFTKPTPESRFKSLTHFTPFKTRPQTSQTPNRPLTGK